MIRVSGLLVALILPILAGCAESYGRYPYDGYYDGYGYGPGYGFGYGYGYFDDFYHHHGRHHRHDDDNAFRFSPHRGVICDRRSGLCRDADGIDEDWTGRLFGDTTPRETPSGIQSRQAETRPEPPEVNSFNRIQRPSRAAPETGPQPQEQQKFRPARPGVDRSSGPTIMMPPSCAGAGCR